MNMISPCTGEEECAPVKHTADLAGRISISDSLGVHLLYIKMWDFL